MHNSKDLADSICGAYTTLLERRASWVTAAGDDDKLQEAARRDFHDRQDGERFR